MREIKFRAKRIDDGKWVYGCLVKAIKPGIWIIVSDARNNPVKTETVGQFTGLKDKNGQDIYEGDILFNERVMFFVEWRESGKWEAIVINSKSEEHGLLYSYGGRYEVKGNIHDNPELLENNNER